MKRFVFLLVTLLSILLTCTQSAANLCEGVSECSCKHERGTTWSIWATCVGNLSGLQNLTTENITRIFIRKSNITEETSLNALQRFTDMHTLTIRQTEVAYFDWNWLPDNCTRIAISYPSYGKIPTKLPQFNRNCSSLRSSLSVKTCTFSYIPYSDIPSCWPASIKTLVFVKVPLTNFGISNKTEPIIWPPNLAFVSIKTYEFTNLDDRVLANAPTNFTKLRIIECEKPFNKFFSNWPVTGQMRSIYLRNCHLNSTQPSDFDNLQQLGLLDLTGNKFKNVPTNLPQSLRTLYLSSNELESTSSYVWTNLTNLKTLDMQKNQLRYVPTNLPEQLEVLILNDNSIVFVDSAALAHLTSLRRLILAKNKLISMPPRLSMTIEQLDISRNDISRVRSASSYDYCINCTIVMYGNPWICDEMMIGLIVWATQTGAKLLFDQKCDKTNPNDVEEVDIEKIGFYFGYLKKSREFQKCKYTINELDCTSSELTRAPRNPPNVLFNLTITQNPNLTHIPDFYFASQDKLIRLDLSRNSLQDFPIGLPATLKNLYLNGNRIKVIPRSAQPTLDNLTQLEEFFLEENLIQVMYDYQLSPLTNLRIFGLEYNPLHCDCSLSSMTLWYQDNSPAPYHHSIPRCATPREYRDTQITQLFGYYRFGLQCIPPLCEWRRPLEPGLLNCSRSTQLERQESSLFVEADSFDPKRKLIIPENTYWQALDLTNLELNENTIELQQLSALRTVILTGNRLKKIPLEYLPEFVEVLILANNSISETPPNIVQLLPKNLKVLDLTNNRFRTVSKSFVSALPLLERVYLEGNPFTCDCNLRPFITYLQALKENNITLENNRFQILKCADPPELRNIALIDLSNEQYCQVATWSNITGGVIGSVSFLLLVSLVAIVALYNRRKRQARKDILRGFKQLLEDEAFAAVDRDYQDEEATGEYEYDAFVSYCSNSHDEEFVYRMLEVLEDERGRKLCIHERDFVPGQGITENIANCIKMSRRIILVITKKYTESAWCQYEVQVALAQIHQHRRGKLLIPILLEDIIKNNDVAGSVKTILSLISGISVPAQQPGHPKWNLFWDKLENSISETALNQNKLVQKMEIAYEVD